jgi:hypothetical protein
MKYNADIIREHLRNGTIKRLLEAITLDAQKSRKDPLQAILEFSDFAYNNLTLDECIKSVNDLKKDCDVQMRKAEDQGPIPF